MFNLMSNRKIHVDITPHCGIYVTIIMRVQDCTENEKALITEKAKEFYEIAERYNGEIYELPVFTPIELGEVVFNNTFVFPNGELTERYVETISHI
ncbi:MAG: hypothetical protein HFJ33_07830 [Clostridia bacterium]|nr:hypothetical protein [Clostridia bacterium]